MIHTHGIQRHPFSWTMTTAHSVAPMAHSMVASAHLMATTTRLMAYGTFKGKFFGTFGLFRGSHFPVQQMAATPATILAIAYKLQQLHQIRYLFSCNLSQRLQGAVLYAHGNLFAVFLCKYVYTHAYKICTHSNISYQFPSRSMSIGLHAVRLLICYV